MQSTVGVEAVAHDQQAIERQTVEHADERRHRFVCGLPAMTGERPPAAATAATIAPPPGISPSGVGYVTSSLVAMSRAPRRTAVAAMRSRS